MLALPDFTKTYQIESDASETAIGGVLTEDNISVYTPIAFLSKILTTSKKNYHVHDCELLESVAC